MKREEVHHNVSERRHLPGIAQKRSVDRCVDRRLARSQIHPELLLEPPADLPLGDRVEVRATQEVVDRPLEDHVRWAAQLIGRACQGHGHVEVVGRRARGRGLVE
jgi:hypothetical protein